MLLIAAQIRQHTFRGPHLRASRLRSAASVLGVVLAGVGGFTLAVGERGWVFYTTLALACMILLASGVFGSWLLVLQIGIPEGDKPSER